MILALLLALSACGMGSASESAATASENPSTAQLSQTAAPAFSDVPADAEYADAVKWCQENGIMNGVSATAFDPDGTLTRAMLAAVLYRAEGEPAVDGDPAFTDTQPGAWYSDAAVWASENGLIRGYGNGLFGTDDSVTREQLTVILQRYRGEEAIWMGDLNLAVPATRAEVAVALYQNLPAKAEGETAMDKICFFAAIIALCAMMAVWFLKQPRQIALVLHISLDNMMKSTIQNVLFTVATYANVHDELRKIFAEPGTP